MTQRESPPMNMGQPAIALSKTRNRIVFDEPARCPTCGKLLLLHWIIQDIFPYPHIDLTLRCMLCNQDYTFGIAMDKGIGLETIVWDTEPDKVLSQALAFEQPICPFHTKRMLVTKIWGDLVMQDQQYIKVQWKCPDWQYTVHGDFQRFAPGNRDDSVHARAIRERLDALGYV